MPALAINTNVASINGQRNIYGASKALNQSLERLSSGLRINRAGDDAAGLQISDSLRTQVRGLDQSVRNCEDGSSLIRTAEGALATYTEILQRIRELAVQASSDVNTDANRASIQLEIDQQVDELNRIAETISFNGQMLFDGTFQHRRIQAGPNRGAQLELSISDARSHIVGSVANIIGVAVDDNALEDGSIEINGIEIPSSATGSAYDKAIAINSMVTDTKVFADVEVAQKVGSTPIQAFTLDNTNYMEINGVRVAPTTPTVISNNDADGKLRRAINAISDETNVIATLDASNQLVLTATNNQEFTFEVDGFARTRTGLLGTAAVEQQVGGRLRLYSDSAFTVENGTGNATNLLGLQGTFGLDSTTAIETVDISTFQNAQEAIFQVDNALRQINETRARLGAIENRLDQTISNLQVVSENFVASESRIRDADFAAESTNLTRAQILQQSSISVLAQANVAPQVALNLLQ